MDTLPIYQIDAFTKNLFGGNPAAVVLLSSLKNYEDQLLQDIAAENNLSETAFLYLSDDKMEEQSPIRLRWFTPKAEVNLCGHATLASAFIYFSEIQPTQHQVIFNTISGNLTCHKLEDKISIRLPKDEIISLPVGAEHISLTNIPPIEVYQGKEDLMLVFTSEEEVQNAIPNLRLIEKIGSRGLIITAKGNNVDVVSRFFTPQLGIDEDPVTGSAHTTLAAYWHVKLDKTKLICKQLSRRSGSIRCYIKEEEIELIGEAKCYMSGEIYTL